MDELTENMLEKCKQSQLAIQMIIESTTDDDGILFEALNLNDERQQVISKFEGLDTGPKSNTTSANPIDPLETDEESTVGATPSTTAANPTAHVGTRDGNGPDLDRIPRSKSRSIFQTLDPDSIRIRWIQKNKIRIQIHWICRSMDRI